MFFETHWFYVLNSAVFDEENKSHHIYPKAWHKKKDFVQFFGGRNEAPESSARTFNNKNFTKTASTYISAMRMTGAQNVLCLEYETWPKSVALKQVSVYNHL